MRRTLIILILTIGLSTFSFGQLKILPRNEVHRDSSLTALICKLQYAIFKKDKDFLLSIVDKNIKNNFGGDGGIEEFKEMWALDKPNSPIWSCLSKVISLGGVFSDYQSNEVNSNSFVFPYVFHATLPDSLDVFETMLVTATNVNVREEPNKTSKIVGKFSYDVVTVDYEKSYPESDTEWYYVSSLDKKVYGYVYFEYVWNIVDYRLFFNKENDEWKITCFIAGD
jgi:hypothetical protein